MKLNIGRFVKVASAAFFIACAPAFAQMGVPNHAVAVGHGAGSGVFGFVGPCAAGVPILGAGASVDPTCSRLGNLGLAQVPAATFKCNPTSGLADLQDCTIAGLTHKGSPDTANDKLFFFDNSTGTFKWCSISECGTASGVSAVNGQAGSVNLIASPAGRCTLTSGTPVTATDVTGATTVYVSPYRGNYTYLYNGSQDVPLAFVQTSLALNAADNIADTNYDVWEFSNAGVYAIGTGPAWAVSGFGTSQRGTGAGSTEYELFNGRLVNKNSITLRAGGSAIGTVAARQANLRCTVRTIGVAGQTEDSVIKRFVSNVYNAEPRAMAVVDTAASWSWSTGSYQQVHANAANQVAYVHAVESRQVEASAVCEGINSTGTLRNIACGIGLNSTTVNSALNPNGISVNANVTSSAPQTAHSRYVGYPGLGSNRVVWLERGDGTDTQTFVGTSGVAYIQTGMLGSTLQ